MCKDPPGGPPANDNAVSKSWFPIFDKLTLPELEAGFLLGAAVGLATYRHQRTTMRVYQNYGAYTPIIRNVIRVLEPPFLMHERPMIEMLKYVGPQMSEAFKQIPKHQSAKPYRLALQYYDPRPMPLVVPVWSNILTGARTTFLMMTIKEQELIGLARKCGIPREPAFDTAMRDFVQMRRALFWNVLKGSVAGQAVGSVIGHPIPVIAGTLNTINTVNTGLNLVGQATEQAFAVLRPEARSTFNAYSNLHFKRTMRPVVPGVVIFGTIAAFGVFAYYAQQEAKAQHTKRIEK